MDLYGVLPVPDKLAAANEFFEIREARHYADGFPHFCRKRGLRRHVGKVSFDGQAERILPIYIRCRHGCGRSWHLEIFPRAIEIIQ